MNFIAEVISEIIRRFSILIISLFLFTFFFVVGLAMWVFITQSGNGIKPPPANDDRSQILASWKVYRNHELNFELMHPPSASIIRRQDGGLQKIRIIFSVIYPGLFQTKYLEISVTGKEKGVCERETIRLGRKIENVSLHGIDFVKETEIVSNQGQTREITDYYTVNEARCYHLSFVVDFKGGFDFGYEPSKDVYYQQETSVFELVLSTFGFISRREIIE